MGQQASRATPTDVGWVESRSGRLEVIWWGDGSRPAAVAHHGFLDHGWTWDTLVPYLHTVDLVSVSARGHGRSDPADSYQWADFVLDLATVIECVAEGPTDVIGHSWGAHLALDLARIRPDLVARLVNIDGMSPNHPDGVRPGLVERVQRLADRPAPRARGGFDSLERAFERRRELTPRVPPTAVRSFVEHGTVQLDGRFQWALDPLLVSGMLPWDGRDRRPVDLEAELIATSAPVLLITGDANEAPHLNPDRTVAWTVGESAPHVRHAHIAGHGHYVHLEAPATVGAIIDGFLR